MAVQRSHALQVYKRFAITAVMVLIGVYAAVNLTGTYGISALLTKWDELHRLQVENANLEKELKERQERVRLLKESQEQRELEIRKKLHKLLPGEKLYQVPDPAPQGGATN
jgi:cell division protein FtsB